MRVAAASWPGVPRSAMIPGDCKLVGVGAKDERSQPVLREHKTNAGQGADEHGDFLKIPDRAFI
jgi:hypothetical protein